MGRPVLVLQKLEETVEGYVSERWSHPSQMGCSPGQPLPLPIGG